MLNANTERLHNEGVNSKKVRSFKISTNEVKDRNDIYTGPRQGTQKSSLTEVYCDEK